METENAHFLTEPNQLFLHCIKKPLRKVIWMQKIIGFHPPGYEIPQLSLLEKLTKTVQSVSLIFLECFIKQKCRLHSLLHNTEP